MELIIWMSNLTWIGIAKMVVIFGLVGAVAYLLRNRVPLEIWISIISKIITAEIKTENEPDIEIPAGLTKSQAKLNYAINVSEAILTDKEKFTLNKKGFNISKIAQTVFTIVSPFLFKKLR